MEEITEAANEKWKKIADNWAAFGPTAKPSGEEIELYRAITLIELSPKENVNAVILGSTPELRDMCHQHFNDKIASVTCVDATEDMYRAMTRLVKEKNPKEKFIHGNWLDLKNFFSEKSVDIIYGDHIVSNLGGKEKELFDGINYILKDNGCFASKIQRTDMSDEKIKIVPAYDKLKEYAEKYRSGEMDLKTAFSQFGLYMLFSSIQLNDDNDMSFIYWKDQIDNLDSQVNQSGDPQEREILDMCEKIWWNWRDVRWTQYDRKVMNKILEENFRIIDEIPAPGHEFTKQTAVYRLHKSKWLTDL